MMDAERRIPLVDLHAQYVRIKPELDEAIAEVIATSSFVRGPHVEAFEASFAAVTQRQHCVSCGNGTDALYIAMMALGLKPGDEVIVPAMSWISSSETVTQAGGKVVFADIDTETHCINPLDIEDKITDRTVGIIPVHLYGHPAPMDKIMKIADHAGLWVLEDCAQAHLASLNGQSIGSFGIAATFSFYPGKNLGAMGDAGAIVTNDETLANHMARFARHGGLQKHEHVIQGINSRLDGIQAAILNVKLRHLSDWTQKRQYLAARYTTGLSKLPGLRCPSVGKGATHVWHLYAVQVEARERLKEALLDRGVSTGINYPCALPLLPCYKKDLHQPSSFPIAHTLSQETLSLPLYPELSEAQQDYVIDAIRAIFGDE
ncbi:DegT/DnrJ/EryC1/StrS family aminotransferase [Roseobacter sp. S98]|uniref:DegT/DnrJ/EryC1/StrS family aminotransferase n=1 Tax=Roseobacter algicola (ex Choi et al. 2025) (nom. illeg.) TaxID=3092138 RepID=UPI003F512218